MELDSAAAVLDMVGLVGFDSVAAMPDIAGLDTAAPPPAGLPAVDEPPAVGGLPPEDSIVPPSLAQPPTMSPKNVIKIIFPRM